MSGYRRFTLRERAWSPYYAVRMFGPLDTDVTALRSALRRMHQADPLSPAVCAADLAGMRWRVLTPEEFANRLETLVIDVSGSSPTDIPSNNHAPSVLNRALIDLELGDRALVIGLCRGYVALKANHAVGDGQVTMRLLADIIEEAASCPGGVDIDTAHTDSGATVADRIKSVRTPLTKAAVRFYLSDPRRAARTLTAARVNRSPRRPDVHPWRPAHTFTTARSAEGTTTRLRASRKALGETASISSVITAQIVAALGDADLPVDHAGICVLVNARRYLPASATVDGNFVVGQLISPSDATDPDAIDLALRDNLASGRALAAMALADLRAFRKADTTPRSAPKHPLVNLTMSHLGGPPALDRLPWSGRASERSLTVVNNPDSPEGMTIACIEFRGAVHLTASFHANTFARANVTRALRLACTRLEALSQTTAATR